MSARYNVRGYLTFAVAVLAATAWTTNVSRSQHSASGVTIQMGVGHFNRDAEAFRHWDKAKAIPPVCSRCHGATNVVEYLKTGKNTPAPQARNGLACTNCHADMLSYARHTVEKVTFPSGIAVTDGDNDSKLCMTCHQGRESTAKVNKTIAGQDLDKVNPKLPFIHVHYFPAGATRYGTEAKVGYEYAGKTYVGNFAHVPNVSSCTSCHDAHLGKVQVVRCGGCHAGVKTVADLKTIRMTTKGDFDGNGREEGLALEIANLGQALYAAIQDYAKTVSDKPIAFTRAAYPYWYADTNGNGRIDFDERKMANKYKDFTPRREQAVYNYTYALRDPGGPYHNGRYVLQLLYDSLESLAASGKIKVDMKNMKRP